MKLRLADPSAIKSKAAEITRIGASVNDPNLYRRIEEACLKKQAFLFVSQECFVILKPTAGPGVLVWIAQTYKAVDRLGYLYEMERFARDISAKHLTFWSNRKGFSKIIPQYGFVAKPAEWMGSPITVWTKKL